MVDGAAERLAERHRISAEPDPVRSLVNYAESPRFGDWTLRSALVRLAQPEAGRAGAVLEVVRRCDAALRPVLRELEGRTVACDRDLSLDGLLAAAPAGSVTVDDPPVGEIGDDPTGDDPTGDDPPVGEIGEGRGALRGGRYPDARVADLARIARRHPADSDAVLAAYDRLDPLSDTERGSIPALEAALALDELGEVLAAWASQRPLDAPPVETVDAICTATWSRMDAAGIPTEQPWTGPRSGRGRG